MSRFNGYISVGISRRRKLRSLFLLAQHQGELEKFAEDKGFFRSKFYLTNASATVWRQAIGPERFGMLLMVLNQRVAVSPYRSGL